MILARDFGKLVGDLTDAFPNPWTMLEAVLNFGTGFAGRILAVPFIGLQKRIQNMLKTRGLHNKLIRADKAVEWAFESNIAFIQTVTMTRASGILEWIATTAARWLWMTFKRWSFLWKLAHVKNEIELVNLFIDKFVKRIGTLRMVGLIIGGFVTLLWAGAQLMAVGMAITVWDGTAEKLFLPQDSSRKRVSVSSYEKRVNKRTGKDKAS